MAFITEKFSENIFTESVFRKFILVNSFGIGVDYL